MMDIRIRNHRFYSSKIWQDLRNLKLMYNPLCEECERNGLTTVATEVDHIISITVSWERRTDWINIQSICKPCHSSKTYQENIDQLHPKPIDKLAEKLKDLLK